LEEFLFSNESAAQIGHWSDPDKREIAVLKLTDSAKLFYQECTELHAESTTWQSFKNEFRRRYEGVHTDQYNFMKLQTARQKKGESPQEFADRCRGLAQKILCKTNDPVAQRMHRENAERMLLISFVSGLSGTPRVQVRYASVKSLPEALRIAIAVPEAKTKERFNESFYTKVDKSVRLLSRSPSRTRAASGSEQHSADVRTVSDTRSQRNRTSGNAGRAMAPKH